MPSKLDMASDLEQHSEHLLPNSFPALSRDSREMHAGLRPSSSGSLPPSIPLKLISPQPACVRRSHGYVDSDLYQGWTAPAKCIGMTLCFQHRQGLTRHLALLASTLLGFAPLSFFVPGPFMAKPRQGFEACPAQFSPPRMLQHQK